MSLANFLRSAGGPAAALSGLLFAGATFAAPQLAEPGTGSLSAPENLSTSSISLPHAIGVIEAKTGGKVTDIHFQGGGGQPIYDAVVVTARDLGVARIYVRRHNDEFSYGSLRSVEREDVKSLDKATVPLASAIQTVEQLSSGRAINAGLAKTVDDNVLAYNIEYAKDGSVHAMAIDARNGEVIADPGALGLNDLMPLAGE